MLILKAYQFKLRCKPRQEAQLRRFAGSMRWVWNQALAKQRERHAAGLKFANYYEMAGWLTAWRNAPQTIWLSDSPVHPQQQVLKRLEKAYKNFFGKTGGFPSFKARGQEPGIRFPDAKQIALDQQNGRIKLPKLGWLRLRQSQEIQGKLCNASIRKDASSWLCSVQVELHETAPALDVAPSLGIDVGLTLFAATSAGHKIAPLKALACQARRLRRYQRSVSRKVKGSANRKAAVAKLGNLHRKIARQRSDWLHKLTTDLADRHAVIAIEDLRIKNMSASAKGTAAAPGKNVRQKAGLNRAILDAAWGEFARQLDYKLQWRGGALVKVNPAYTSQTCNVCGHCEKENRKSQALFACVACGHTENADINAAKNILAAGHAVWADSKNQPQTCGEDVSRTTSVKKKRAASAKQEPTESLTCV